MQWPAFIGNNQVEGVICFRKTIKKKRISYGRRILTVGDQIMLIWMTH